MVFPFYSPSYIPHDPLPFLVISYALLFASSFPFKPQAHFFCAVAPSSLMAFPVFDLSGSSLSTCTPCRVLKPGHAFMLVTYGDPASRLPYMEDVVGWDIFVYVLTKQEVLEAMDSEPMVRPLIKGVWVRIDVYLFEGNKHLLPIP